MRLAVPALAAATALAAACGSHAQAPAGSPPGAVARIAPRAPNELAPPEAFATIADPAARSRALFGEVSKVLAHPRCVNCHTPDDSPRQGDAHAFHDPPVTRGPGDRGVAGMQCQGCHQDRNLELVRVPGAPGWHLAPLSMVWLDQRPDQICAQLSDPKRNGQRSLAQVYDHLAHDKLVAWGWAPGANRAPAPGNQAALAALFAAWIDTGAVCPEAPR
jgi:hypothetical protein